VALAYVRTAWKGEAERVAFLIVLYEEMTSLSAAKRVARKRAARVVV